MWVLQRGHSGDGCGLAPTLCKYDLRKGDVFVLSWARAHRPQHYSQLRRPRKKLGICGGCKVWRESRRP